MRRNLTLLSLAAAVIACAGIALGQVADGPWPMFRHDVRHTGVSTYNGPTVPVLGWSYRIGGDIMSSPSLDAGGRLYIGANIRAYCLNSKGAFAWSYQASDWITYSSPALERNYGRVYIGSVDNIMWCLNSNGSKEWDRNLAGSVRSSPTINASNWVIFGTDNNRMWAIDEDGGLRWSYLTGGPISSSPAIDPWNRTIFASEDQNIYCINSSGARDWYYIAGGPIQSSPAVDSAGRTYIGANDNRVYCLSSTGTRLWSYQTGDDIGWSSPAIALDGGVLIGSRDNRVYSLRSNGSLNWTFPAGADVESSPAVDASGRVYVGSSSNNLYCLNSNGTLLWTYQMNNDVFSSPAIGSDGRVYVGAVGLGIVYCIGPTPTPTPTRTPTPTATPTPLLDVLVNSHSLSAGEQLAVDVEVQPLAGSFDAWGVIMGEGGIYSFVLGSPGELREGAYPLARNVPGLASPYAARLLDMVIPGGAQGSYDVIVGLVPAGVSPTGPESAIPGYVDQEPVRVE